MKLFTYLYSAGLFFFALTTDIPAVAQTHTPKYISMSGKTKAYYEYLPEGYNPSGTTTYPLILFMTGIGEFGTGSTTDLPKVLKNGIPKLIQAGTFPKSFVAGGATHRFIIITPQWITSPRPGADDVEAVLNYIVRQYKVNTRRIYITGLSYGGGTSFAYPGNNSGYGGRVAAIVPVASSFPGPGDQTTGNQIINARSRIIAAANVPVWAFHNSGDPAEPVATTNAYITAINQAPAPTPLAKKTIFNAGGHDAWTKAYDPAYKEANLNIYQWLLQYQRPAPAKKIQVDVGTTVYNDLGWNNWNTGTTAATNISATAFRYYDGAASTVSATLSVSSGTSDNGSTYGSTNYLGSMAPIGVLRQGSYATATSRTLTLKGLSTTKTYALDLYASRSTSTAGSTVFKIGTTSKTINVVNNFNIKASFTGLKPNASGQIVITITKTGTYNYLSGFTLFESATTALTAAPDVDYRHATTDNQYQSSALPALSLAPNPAFDNIVLGLNNDYTGTVQVRVFDASGRSRKAFRFVKPQALIRQNVSVSGLPAGVYLLSIQLGNRTESLNFIKR